MGLGQLAVQDIEVSGWVGGGAGWSMWMQEARTVDTLKERDSPLRHSQSKYRLPAIRVLLLQTAYNYEAEERNG
jgi:hypothetical protein